MYRVFYVICIFAVFAFAACGGDPEDAGTSSNGLAGNSNDSSQGSVSNGGNSSAGSVPSAGSSPSASGNSSSSGGTSSGSGNSSASSAFSSISSAGSSSNGIGIASHVMVQIAAGTFSMGSPGTESERHDDETQHSVALTKGFLMGKYQVTQELYQMVMGSNPSYFTTDVASEEVQAKRPVEEVSWYDALVFCNRLSALENLTPVYSINGSTDPSAWGSVPTSSDAAWNAVTANWNANGYRLPTEAEWEYACRAGTTTTYNFGNSWSGDWGWYDGNSNSKTHEVGMKTPNAWGLYDMHGNVWEQCWDRYDADYYTEDGADMDPRGPTSRSSRVVRGGSWDSGAQSLRSAYRLISDPFYGDICVGFRVVRVSP